MKIYVRVAKSGDRFISRNKTDLSEILRKVFHDDPVMSRDIAVCNINKLGSVSRYFYKNEIDFIYSVLRENKTVILRGEKYIARLIA